MVAGDGAAMILQTLIPPFRSRAILGRPTRARLTGVVDAVAAGQLVVSITDRFPLVEVEAAHQLSQGHRLTGKLVLLPR